MMFTAPKEIGIVISVLKRLVFADCLPAFRPESDKVTKLTMFKDLGNILL